VRPSSRRRRSAGGRRSGRVRPSESGAQDRLSYSLPGNDLRFAPSGARFRSRAIRAGRAWPPAAAHGEPPRTAGSTAATSTEPFRDGRPAVLRFRLHEQARRARAALLRSRISSVSVPWTELSQRTRSSCAASESFSTIASAPWDPIVCPLALPSRPKRARRLTLASVVERASASRSVGATRVLLFHGAIV
jgi:hypothetical protein